MTIDGQETLDILLVFYAKDNVVAWDNFANIHRFTPATFRLLHQMWTAPHQFISKEDLRVDIQYDEESSDDSVRMCIKRARQELEKSGCPYQIDTIHGMGYRLVKRNQDMLQLENSTGVVRLSSPMGGEHNMKDYEVKNDTTIFKGDYRFSKQKRNAASH